MSCKNTTAPVDIKQSYQLCKDLCAYSFEYNPNSSCTVTNMGDYLEIKTDGPDKATFNEVEMSVTNVRIYQPSLHSFNGSPADAEIIIQHSTNAGGNVLICRPIETGEAAGSSKGFFSQFIPHASDQEGDTTQVNVSKWSLNDVIPYKAPFYYYPGPFPYPPCTSGTNGNNIVVYGSDQAANMSQSDIRTLRSLIGRSTPLDVVADPTSALLYNRTGATSGAAVGPDDKYDIYMDCDPITGLDAGGQVIGAPSLEPQKEHIGRSFEKFARSPAGVFVWILLGLFIVWLFVMYMLPGIAERVKFLLPGKKQKTGGT